MRITKKTNLEEYKNVKTAIYNDFRCVISRIDDDNLICIFSEYPNKVSKRQKEWIRYIARRIAKREFGEFEITEPKSESFYLLINRNDKKEEKNKRDRL